MRVLRWLGRVALRPFILLVRYIGGITPISLVGYVLAAFVGFWCVNSGDLKRIGGAAISITLFRCVLWLNAREIRDHTERTGYKGVIISPLLIQNSIDSMVIKAQLTPGDREVSIVSHYHYITRVPVYVKTTGVVILVTALVALPHNAARVLLIALLALDLARRIVVTKWGVLRLLPIAAFMAFVAWTERSMQLRVLCVLAGTVIVWYLFAAWRRRYVVITAARVLVIEDPPWPMQDNTTTYKIVDLTETDIVKPRWAQFLPGKRIIQFVLIKRKGRDEWIPLPLVPDATEMMEVLKAMIVPVMPQPK